MSEPNSASDPTPAVPPAPSFTYGNPVAQPGQPAEPLTPLAPPAYGERLPAPSGPPAYGAPASSAAPVKARRTWDLVLTIILLVVGFFGAGLGLLYGFIFLNPSLLVLGLDERGLDTTVGDTSGAGIAIIVTHALLYLIAAGVGILLLVKKKIAFYVPLAAGVIAAVIFFVCVAIAATEIPGLMGGYNF